MDLQAAPFSIRILGSTHDEPAQTPFPGDHVPAKSLFPASYRIGTHSIRAAHPRYAEFLEQEFDLDKLNSIYNWLWVAGRPMPPRPLHQQLVLGREIVVAERIDLHLIWATGRIFIKPLPSFLLEPSFWCGLLSCVEDHDNAQLACSCTGTQLRKKALGFLLSYMALIMYQSDFAIAQERYLIPKEIKWSDWRTFVDQVLERSAKADQKIDPRFTYGELRLGRLNKIYMFTGRFRGYMTRWNESAAFFRDNFAWLAAATIYIAVVLGAFQVGLSTSLGDNPSFQAAAYGFTLFSILGPLFVCGLVSLRFCYIFIDNCVEALRFSKERLRAARVQP